MSLTKMMCAVRIISFVLYILAIVWFFTGQAIGVTAFGVSILVALLQLVMQFLHLLCLFTGTPVPDNRFTCVMLIIPDMAVAFLAMGIAVSNISIATFARDASILPGSLYKIYIEYGIMLFAAGAFAAFANFVNMLVARKLLHQVHLQNLMI